MMPLALQDSSEVIALIRQRGLDQTRSIIAIDGLSGAGKSTLARAIVAASTSATHIEYDWFHHPYAMVSDEQSFDHARLIQEVIEPFRHGAAMISCARYNWGYLAGVEDGYHPEPFTCQMPNMLVVEGSQILHPAISPLVDLRIWVGTDAPRALQQGIHRDIHEYGLDPVRVHDAWREWAEREQRLLQRDNRRLRAQITMS